MVIGRKSVLFGLTGLLLSCTQDSGVKVYNTAPIISITAPNSGDEYNENDVVTFEALARDDATDSQDLMVDFVSDRDGVLSDTLNPDVDGVVVYNTANLTPGEHVVTATVLDSAAASGTDYITVLVIDVPDAPEIAIVHPVPGEYAVEGESYEFVATVSDEQDAPDDIQVSVRTDIEGSIPACVAMADATGVAACSAILTPGEHFVTFEAEDTDGYTSSATVYFEVREGALVDNDGDGQTEQGGDCDDADPSVYDGAEEFQNGIDDDCDGEVDEGTDAYDDDGDCYCEDAPCMGSVEPACVTLVGGDCDDTNATIFPVASELCDSQDNDCDGQIDEDDAVDAPEWFVDLDGDGYGNPANGHASCIAPFGHVADDSDCNDTDAAVNPLGTEVCNGADDDCDGVADEGVESTYWLDSDGDGHGNPARPQDACAVPTGYSMLDDDCDDADSAVSPSASEYCNGVDDDCDGTVDEDDALDALTWYGDNDGDGYGYLLDTQQSCSAMTGYLSTATDCNDADAAVNPAAAEMCDGLDNNCDGLMDDSTAVDASTWYADTDGDGFGDPNNIVIDCWQSAGYLLNATDCNDANSGVHPGASEICNGSDDDCDALIDEGVGSTYYQDADGDGYGDPSANISSCSPLSGYVINALDCDDTPGTGAAFNPTTIWYRDQDGDGQGTPTDLLAQCSQPGGYVLNNTDCNDQSAAAYFGATEVCDGIDNDCDYVTDEQNASGCSTYYNDSDNDGFGTTISQCLCTATGDYTAVQAGDCYDLNADAHPNATANLFWLLHRGDGSWDYDCDGQQSQIYTSHGYCTGGYSSCGGYAGWNSYTPPSCGSSGQWVDACEWPYYGVCNTSLAIQYQYCR